MSCAIPHPEPEHDQGPLSEPARVAGDRTPGNPQAGTEPGPGGYDDLPAAARRALSEAAARREALSGQPRPPEELGGRTGPEPVRYGDWEKNGLAIDF
jgi:hypothetical protein